MESLLESILKASAQSVMQQDNDQTNQAAADPISDLLGGILGGNKAPQQRAPAQQSDPINDILGGILGGNSQNSRSAPRQQASGGGIQDLIGGLIGGNASKGQQHQNGMADMLQIIMGGASGRSNASNNFIAKMLSDKLGIPPAIASAAVAFFMAKMIERQMDKQRRPSGQGGRFEAGGSRIAADSLDLDDLLDSMDDDDTLGMKFNESGMANDLARKTGLSPDQANHTLQEIVHIVGVQRAKPRPVSPKESNLKGLLDEW